MSVSPEYCAGISRTLAHVVYRLRAFDLAQAPLVEIFTPWRCEVRASLADAASHLCAGRA